LKVAAEAGKRITLEGQDKDVTTAGVARMNMILHDFPTANIVSGDTLTDPKVAAHFRLGFQRFDRFATHSSCLTRHHRQLIHGI